jgi:hypothetical protein
MAKALQVEALCKLCWRLPLHHQFPGGQATDLKSLEAVVAGPAGALAS